MRRITNRGGITLKKKLLLFFTVFIGMLTITSPAFAYTKWMNVTQFTQEQPDWCGAAAAKTNMTYEDDTHSEYSNGNPSQQTIWNYIRTQNIENSLWATDPRGLSRAIYNWTPSAHYYADWNYSFRTTAIHGAAWTMDKWTSPVELLIADGSHWVTLTAFDSTVSPYASPSTASIIGFRVQDPLVGSPGSSYFTDRNEYVTAQTLGDIWADPLPAHGSHWDGRIVTVERDSTQGISKYNTNQYANY